MNYVVRPDGADKESINQLMAMPGLQPGDVIQMRDGKYKPICQDLRNVGVIIQPYLLEQPILTGITVVAPKTTISNVSIIEKGVMIGPKADRAKLEKCEIFNCSGCGVYAYDCLWTIEGCKIHDNGKDHHHHGIYASGKAYKVISNCEIYRNSGCGIHFFSSQECISNMNVLYNTLYDNEAGNLLLGADMNFSMAYLAVKGNKSYYTDSHFKVRGVDVGYLGLDNQYITIEDNDFSGGRHALAVRGVKRNCTVRNNTLISDYSDSEEILALEWNNTFIQSSNPTYIVEGNKCSINSIRK